MIEKEAEIRSLQMNYEEMRQSLEDKIKDLELQVSSLTTKLKIENESNNELNQKVGNFDTKLQARLKEALTEMENKDREIIRQNQKNHDEEVCGVLSVWPSRLQEFVNMSATSLRSSSRRGPWVVSWERLWISWMRLSTSRSRWWTLFGVRYVIVGVIVHF